METSESKQLRLILSIVMFASGVVFGHGAVARWNLSLQGVVTARNVRVYQPNGRRDVFITLDGKRTVKLDYRNSETHDLRMLQVGDRVDKRPREMSVVVNGSRRQWWLSEAAPAYIGCVVFLLGTAGLLKHLYRRYLR